MATLEMIEQSKPLTFVGHRTTISQDQELLTLANRLGNDRLKLVARPVTEEIEVNGEAVLRLMRVVSTSSQRHLFERNLQGMAETAKQEPLLTGWMPTEDMLNFLNAHQIPGLEELTKSVVEWRKSDVEDVYFDAHKKVEKDRKKREFEQVKSELVVSGNYAGSIEFDPEGNWIGMLFEKNYSFNNEEDQIHFAKLAFNYDERIVK